jgi:hypothetical protein
MSLNDFEYVDHPSTFSTFEEGDMEIFELSVAKAILRKEEAYRAIDALADSTGESWFELGEKLAEKKFMSVLDKLEKSLLDSEEDALMTIHLIRKMIEEENGQE